MKTIQEIELLLPFELLGIDNGSEFLNAHLISYKRKHDIQFTRSRPYRKNDSCFVEQKNNSVVRRYVGYLRDDGSYSMANTYAQQVLFLITVVVPSIRKRQILLVVLRIYLN